MQRSRGYTLTLRARESEAMARSPGQPSLARRRAIVAGAVAGRRAARACGADQRAVPECARGTGKSCRVYRGPAHPVEIIIALSISAVVTAGSIALYKAQRLQADIEITKRNAFQLLEAGRLYYSINREFPPNVDTLVSQGLVGSSTVPVNPLGGSFAILGTNVSGDIGHVIVRASITRGGTPSEMVKPLDANGTYSTDSVEWRKIAAEYGSASARNLESFRNSYGGGATLDISANTSNYNLFTMLGSPPTPVNVTLTIQSGVVVSSNSPSEPAFDTGNLPSGSIVTLINNGTISGRGGNGGNGDGCWSGGGSWNHSCTGATAGQAGGDAMVIRMPITIDNSNGVIRGGGGGGGGGYAALIWNLVKTGGGGGGGSGDGQGGLGSQYCDGSAGYACTSDRCMGRGGNGTNGTQFGPGAGGNGIASSNWVNGEINTVDAWDENGNYVPYNTCTPSGTGYGGYSGAGGAGGDWGEAGSTGGSSGVWGWCGCSGDNYHQGGGAGGGAGGRAIRTNGHAVTWVGGNDSAHVKGAVN